jgi:ankyrin repeat protein
MLRKFFMQFPWEKGSYLKYAISHDCIDILPHLISAGPSSYYDALNCLFLAAELGKTDLLSQMFEAGWDLHSKKMPFGESLLHQAARFGQAETCQELINLGLDPNYHIRYLRSIICLN